MSSQDSRSCRNSIELQINNLEKRRSELEREYPGLATILPGTSPDDLQAEVSAARARLAAIAAERARLAGIEARTQALSRILMMLVNRARRCPRLRLRSSNSSGRKKSKRTIISISRPALRRPASTKPWIRPKCQISASCKVLHWHLEDQPRAEKVVLGLAGGGIGLGLAFAFLIELVLDRTVKRPLEIEMLLGDAPYALHSIRQRTQSSGVFLSRDAVPDSSKNRAQSPAPWELWAFRAAILPRRSATVSCSISCSIDGPQAQTRCSDGLLRGCRDLHVAAGLAAALSETGDGKVLIVDMNIEGRRFILSSEAHLHAL